MRAVSNAVRLAKENQHWSGLQLARELGKDDSTVSRWESGQVTSIDVVALVRLFELAGLSMDQEFGLPVDPDLVDARAWRERCIRAEGVLDMLIGRKAPAAEETTPRVLSPASPKSISGPWREETPPAQTIAIPLYGSAAAGYGSANEPRVAPLDYVHIPARMKPSDGTLVALRVHGDSMEPRIAEGDVIVVWHPSRQPAMRLLKRGALVLITTQDWEDMVKEFGFDPATGQDLLLSANPAYPPQQLPVKPRFVGLVKMVVREQ